MALVVAAQVDADVEEFLRAQTRVEAHAATTVPVAVDVHRHGGAHARLVVVGGLVVDAVAGGAEPQP